MFENLKEKAVRHKILATILFGAIIVVFALFSYQPPSENSLGGFAARVNHQIISVQEYRQAFEQAVAFYSQMFGGNFDAEAQKKMRMKSSVLEELISRAATVQAAEKSGISVPNEEIRDLIVGIPAFQKDGKFQREAYDTFLANRQMSASQFENEIRRDLAFGKVRDLFQKTMTPSGVEAEKLARVEEVQYNLEFLKLDTERLFEPANVSKSEAETYLANPAGLKKAEEYFAVNKAQFDKEEQVRARHILIKTEPGQDEKAALKKVEAIQLRLAKESFEDLAKKESQDQGSATKGGDLGFFSRGRMVPEFEKAAFEGEVGKVIGPIKSDFGYHLIRVEEKRPKQIADFNAEKLQIVRVILAREKGEKAIAALRAAIETGKMSQVTAEAAKLGIKWEETGSFSLADPTIPKIGDSEATFQIVANLTPENSLARQLVTAGNVEYAVRLKAKTKKTLAKAKTEESVQQRMAMMRSREAFQKWSEKVISSSKVERNDVLLRDEM